MLINVRLIHCCEGGAISVLQSHSSRWRLHWFIQISWTDINFWWMYSNPLLCRNLHFFLLNCSCSTFRYEDQKALSFITKKCRRIDLLWVWTHQLVKWSSHFVNLPTRWQHKPRETLIFAINALLFHLHWASDGDAADRCRWPLACAAKAC